MSKILMVLGSLNAFLGVGLGAFGAHGLRGKISGDLLVVYQTGVQYHLVHALGLVLIGILVHLYPQSSLLHWGGGLLMAGIVLFSGSLYVLAISGERWIGAITPFGGMAFLVGWLLVAAALLKR